MAKKFNKQYIDKADKLIREILNDEKEYDDWTQISLTVQNAVQAAANIYGARTDEEIYKLRGFITELLCATLHNLKTLDITFKKKENG
jgi:hypothetical protein|nr:MAG: hypothetical protein [Bacteriophage sp.]